MLKGGGIQMDECYYGRCPYCGNEDAPLVYLKEDATGDTLIRCNDCGNEFWESDRGAV